MAENGMLTLILRCGIMHLKTERRFFMVTYQDYLAAVTNDSGEIVPERIAGFVQYAIDTHKGSDDYEIATNADLYEKQKNVTINNYVRTIYSLAGAPVEDFTASNNKIASNFFHRLNSQRCTYSLGNGIHFVDDPDDELKKSLGKKFDNRLFDLCYAGLIHKVSFGFWNVDQLYVFPFTQFVPLWDEMDGTLKAGIRFWQIDSTKPMSATLYEIEGWTMLRSIKAKKEGGAKDEFVYKLVLDGGVRNPYKKSVWTNQVGDVVEEEVLGAEQYSLLPIVPFWGSKRQQSTLVGMQQAIDSFDLIRSGFANDLTDCAEIYWLIENYGGMTEEELARFRDRLKINHIVEVATGNGGSVRPYTQDIPYQARKIYLEDIKAGIYEDFGGLDVHQVSANSTNDHLQAAYQPMDEEADDFEYQIIEFILQLLKVVGVEEKMPIFKRNQIVNQKEQVDMVMEEAEYLDTETILDKLPNITSDEVQEILKRREAEDRDRMPIKIQPNEEKIIVEGTEEVE
jgi:hypothetical protein